MKRTLLQLAAGAVGLCLMAGCIVLSVYPFYTPRDVTFDPGLAGRWMNASDTNELWSFAAVDQLSYAVTVNDSQSTNDMVAHLFRLRQYEFLDLLTTNRHEFEMPMHLVSKVARNDNALTLQFMDYGWLSDLLATNPRVLRHIVVPTRGDDTNNGSMVYLTAETRGLQKFLLKHVADTNAFNPRSAVQLMRVGQ